MTYKKMVAFTLKYSLLFWFYFACVNFVPVKFRFVVFRPFIDEVIVGKIRNCISEGVRGNDTFELVYINY